jgi:hypothetical protein
MSQSFEEERMSAATYEKHQAAKYAHLRLALWIGLMAAFCGTSGVAAAQDGKKVDPTDPTNITLNATPAYEYTRLSEGGGHTSTFSVDTWIPLSKQDLFTIEMQVVHSDITGLPRETGFGDMRMKYFHLISTPNRGMLRAWAPAFDMIVPTGDADKGTGGGSWLLMPNFVLALNLSERVSAYPFFRYVHSIPKSGSAGVFAPLLPGIDLPILDPDADGLLKFNSGKVRGFNLEVPIAVGLTDSLFFTATPNLFHNFAEGGATTFSSKFQFTYQPSESVALGIETTVPISGDSGIDYSVKPTAQIYF